MPRRGSKTLSRPRPDSAASAAGVPRALPAPLRWALRFLPDYFSDEPCAFHAELMQVLADPAKREAWVREKGLTVFSTFSSDHPATEIDLFVETPFDFERAYASAERLEVAPGIEATFVGLADLIAMKRRAGRPQDLQDVAELESLPRLGKERDG